MIFNIEGSNNAATIINFLPREVLFAIFFQRNTVLQFLRFNARYVTVATPMIFLYKKNMLEA